MLFQKLLSGNYFQLSSDSRSNMVRFFCVSRRRNGTDGLHGIHYIIASLSWNDPVIVLITT